MSFRCDNCGHRDSEINSAGEIQRECPPTSVNPVHRLELSLTSNSKRRQLHCSSAQPKRPRPTTR